MYASERKWLLKETDEEKVRALYDALKINPSICRILVQRDIYTFDQARNFFRPDINDLHDPFLMKDMDKAVERLMTAFHQKEKILVYGDYDVDGTTSVTMVYSFLKHFYPHLDYYIPNRYTEGYGVSWKGIEFAKENGFSLIIALDCGIKAVEKIAKAKEVGVDFIVCDHHLPGDDIPPAVAVLDPKQKDCKYPYKELSGCGVGFKLISALKQKYPAEMPDPMEYLDLVAVSIGCDIVPVTGENRILAYHGLKKVNTSPRKGIKAILKTGGIEPPVTIMDLVFMVGPRINAAGRMDSARGAVSALLAEDESNAFDKAAKLNTQNNIRKEVDKSITNEASELLIADTSYPFKKTTVVFKPHWHKGVIGIVASRLVERFYKPTIVFTESNGMITGSARSIQGFNIYEAIKSCSEYLEQFGGHFYAAGLSLKPENLEHFTQKFEEVVATSITDDLLIPKVEIDTELAFEDISAKFLNILNQMAPFGPGNMRPVFMSKELSLYGKSRIVGENHLKAAFTKAEAGTLQAIGFGLGSKFDLINNSPDLDVCFCIAENEWQGVKSIQLELKDLKKSRETIWN